MPFCNSERVPGLDAGLAKPTRTHLPFLSMRQMGAPTEGGEGLGADSMAPFELLLELLVQAPQLCRQWPVGALVIVMLQASFFLAAAFSH